MVDGLVKISNPKIFYKGQYICREGEAGDEMYIVLSGSVLDYYEAAFTAQAELHTAEEKQKCAMIIAELYMASGDRDSAHAYFTKAAEYPGTELRGKAHQNLEKFWNEASRSSGQTRGG